MALEPLRTAIDVTATGLTLGSFVLLLHGRSHALGFSFRATIEPILRSIRNSTALSRPQLADASALLAIGFAGLAAIFEKPVAGILLMGLLAWARPMIRRATREENKLLALAGTISIDLVIGVYVPMVMAQLLLLNFFIAASMLAIIVALSWPAGGGQTIPGRTWRLASVR